MLRATLVTGVSRRRGIGFAIAQRLLAEDGARAVAHSYAPYDATQPWDLESPMPSTGSPNPIPCGARRSVTFSGDDTGTG